MEIFCNIGVSISQSSLLLKFDKNILLFSAMAGLDDLHNNEQKRVHSLLLLLMES